MAGSPTGHFTLLKIPGGWDCVPNRPGISLSFVSLLIAPERLAAALCDGV